MHKQYIAGFIDGEGHVGIIKMKPQEKYREKSVRYIPKITIVNTNKRILEIIQNKLGGSLCERKQEKPHHKKTYSLQIYGNSLKRALPFLSKYLIIKKKQTECLKEMIKTQRHTARGNPYTQKELQQKEMIYKKCIELNHLGM